MIEIDLRDIFLFGHLETRTNYFFILKEFYYSWSDFLCAKMMTRHAIYLFYLNILYFYHIDISKKFIETFWLLFFLFVLYF